MTQVKLDVRGTEGEKIELTLEVVSRGEYKIKNTFGELSIGFTDLSGSAVNQDHDSDAYSCFGISEEVVSDGITFTPTSIKGPGGLISLRKAARNFKVRQYDPGDI